MELKSKKVAVKDECKRCSNRTFMELKSDKTERRRKSYMVLIVPLWNWNLLNDVVVGWSATGSNRTFMELKYDTKYLPPRRDMF